MRAVEDHGVANHAAEVRARGAGEFLRRGVFVLGLEQPHLDQLVVEKRLLHGLHHRRRDPGGSHLHDRLLALDARPEEATLLPREAVGGGGTGGRHGR